MTAGRPHPRSRLHHLLRVENGALLWVPALLVAATVLLWAIQKTPSSGARFSQADELLLILGRIAPENVEHEVARRFRGALRADLEAQREFRLVPDDIFRSRMQRTLGSSAADDPLVAIRATRNLKARFYLSGALQRTPDGVLQVQLDVWEAAAEQPVEGLRLHAADVEALAQALADSLGTFLFEPRLQRSARR